MGYCQECGKKEEMKDIYTDRLPNGSFVHRGIGEVCGSRIWKNIKDEEILVTKPGRRIPKEVYVRKLTPKVLYTTKVGQKIWEGKKFYINELEIEVKTLKELKREVRENEKMVSSSLRGSVNPNNPYPAKLSR